MMLYCGFCNNMESKDIETSDYLFPVEKYAEVINKKTDGQKSDSSLANLWNLFTADKDCVYFTKPRQKSAYFRGYDFWNIPFLSVKPQYDIFLGTFLEHHFIQITKKYHGFVLNISYDGMCKVEYKLNSALDCICKINEILLKGDYIC